MNAIALYQQRTWAWMGWIWKSNAGTANWLHLKRLGATFNFVYLIFFFLLLILYFGLFGWRVICGSNFCRFFFCCCCFGRSILWWWKKARFQRLAREKVHYFWLVTWRNLQRWARSWETHDSILFIDSFVKLNMHDNEIIHLAYLKPKFTNDYFSFYTYVITIPTFIEVLKKFLCIYDQN